MAQRIFNADINFNGNQSLNMVLQNLSVHPSTTGLTAGFVYYNTTQDTVYAWTGSIWLDLGLSGITNLSLGTITGTTIPINNDNGTGVVLPSATQSDAGLLSAADKAKLDSLTNGASVSSFSAGDLTPLFSTNVTNPTTTPHLSFSLTNAAANSWFGNATSGATSPSFNSAGALTKTDDTNVKLTLSGTPATALLKNVAIDISWAGVLSISRGGTGLSSLGTAGQLLRVNTGETGLEYFTPDYGTGTVTSVGLTAPTSVFNVGNSPITSSGNLALTFKSQTAGTFLAAPVSSNGVPTFRAIQPKDLGTGTTDTTTYLRGDGTWFNLINDSTTTTSSTWSSSKIQDAINNALVGGMKYIGGYNASTNTPNLTTPATGAVKKGYTYTVTTAGTFFGEDLEVGDFLISEVDDPSTVSDWTIVNKNIPPIETATQTVFGITRYGTQAEVDAGASTTLAVSPATLKGYLDNNSGRYTQSFGDGSAVSFTITHNLNELYVICQTVEIATGIQWEFEVTRVNANTIQIDANTPPTSGQFMAIITT